MATFADARVQEMLRGRKAVRVYSMPFAHEIEVGVRVLSDQEIDDCRLEAQRYVEKRGAKMDIDPDFLERETRRQIIWRAFVDAADRESAFFASDAAVRELDAEMVRSLFDLYSEHQVFVSPFRHLDAAGVKELAEALGKEHDARAYLADCGSDTLRSLCLTLASAVRST
jgi:hypothetical protein